MDSNSKTRRSFLALIGATAVASGVGSAQPNGNGRSDAKGQTNQEARVVLNTQRTDGTEVTVPHAVLPEGGYISIHDARTRLYDDADVEERIVKSLIGVTDLLDAGKHTQVRVPLFNDAAPAVKNFGREGPLTESQPLICIPHVNSDETGDEFLLEQREGVFLFGDGAYSDGKRKLTQLGAVNDYGTALLEGASGAEIREAQEETREVRDDFK